MAARPPRPVAFPLSASANGRHLVDRNGVPFIVHGDTAWDASVSVTLAEWRAYLDDRRNRGFNTVLGVGVAIAVLGALNTFAISALVTGAESRRANERARAIVQPAE